MNRAVLAAGAKREAAACFMYFNVRTGSAWNEARAPEGDPQGRSTENRKVVAQEARRWNRRERGNLGKRGLRAASLPKGERVSP